MVQTGPPARGGTVLRTLWVSASEATLGRSAPLPRLPGGGPHFSREMGRKRAGGKPPGPPVFMAARSHSLGLGLVGFGTVEGLLPPVC